MNPLIFAITKHDGQVRKGTGLPYVLHPIKAYLILKDAGYSEKVCNIALLHDTLEDTNTDMRELSFHFGDETAECVKAVSKNLSGEFNFEEASYLPLIVKTADTLSNVEEYIAGNEGVSKKKIEKYCENLKIAQARVHNDALEQRIHNALKVLI